MTKPEPSKQTFRKSLNQIKEGLHTEEDYEEVLSEILNKEGIKEYKRLIIKKMQEKQKSAVEWNKEKDMLHWNTFAMRLSVILKNCNKKTTKRVKEIMNQLCKQLDENKDKAFEDIQNNNSDVPKSKDFEDVKVNG